MNSNIGRLSIGMFLKIMSKTADGGVNTDMPSGEGALWSSRPVSMKWYRLWNDKPTRSVDTVQT